MSSNSAEKKKRKGRAKSRARPEEEGEPAPSEEEQQGALPESLVEKSALRHDLVPVALILSRHSDVMRERAARGFSFGELLSAGLSPGAAKRIRLMIDYRRRSVLDHNVERLKQWYKPEPTKSNASSKKGVDGEKESKPKREAKGKTKKKAPNKGKES